MRNLAGIVTVISGFVVGFTGVINTWADLVIKMWQYGQLAEMKARHPDKPSLKQLSLLRTAEPECAAVVQL